MKSRAAVPDAAMTLPLLRALEVRLERYKKTGRLAAGHDAMIEGQRQREEAAHRQFARVHPHPQSGATGAHDHPLGPHHYETVDTAAGRAEAGQRNVSEPQPLRAEPALRRA